MSVTLLTSAVVPLQSLNHMRVLFDIGANDLRNKGNVALLQVAVSRIHRLWPRASLEVVTLSPSVLRLYCPGAVPISVSGSDATHARSMAWQRFTRAIPSVALRLSLEAREELWRRWPRFGSHLTGRGLRALFQGRLKREAEGAQGGGLGSAANDVAPHQMPAALDGIDLFVAAGAQYMADACRDDAIRILSELQAASERGIPTAMVSQGFGPLEDPELRERARAVLPLVDLIFVRERLAAPPLLEALGVDASHIVFTGDDAIELAHEAYNPRRGTAIGVGIRIADYAGVTVDDIDLLRQPLLETAARYGAKLITISISQALHERDDRVLESLIGGYKNVVHRRWRFDSPMTLIRMVGCCRIVVTGSLHTAIFAVGQGIPAVCVAKSRMYVEKFEGLADQLGPGCQVVNLHDGNVKARLATAMQTAWEGAHEFETGLLKAAARQIALGKAAYDRLYALAESRTRGAGQGIEGN